MRIEQAGALMERWEVAAPGLARRLAGIILRIDADMDCCALRSKREGAQRQTLPWSNLVWDCAGFMSMLLRCCKIDDPTTQDGVRRIHLMRQYKKLPYALDRRTTSTGQKSLQ